MGDNEVKQRGLPISSAVILLHNYEDLVVAAETDLAGLKCSGIVM